jgi:hypothetical protein
MLPAAVDAASCGSYLLFFGAYELIIALMSLNCAIFLKQMTVEAIRAGGNAGLPSRFHYRYVLFGNLLTLPMAAATTVFDRDLMTFGVFACIVALLSLRCVFILRTGVTEATGSSSTDGLPVESQYFVVPGKEELK